MDTQRRAIVRAVLAEKRRRYPALRHVPTYRDLRAICDREDVAIVQDARLPMAGALVGFDGEWTLLLSSRLAFALCPPTMLHELAHLWCHHDPYAERDEILFTFLADESTDPREEEADYFVSLVFGDHFATRPIASLIPDAAHGFRFGTHAQRDA